MVTTCGLAPVRFQFLIGRLDTYTSAAGKRKADGFQFLIGRLDTHRTELGAVHRNGFQFLIGRLDTRLSEDSALWSKLRFNSS